MDVTQLVSDARNTNVEQIKNLLGQVVNILEEEREEGKQGPQKIKGGLVELEPEGVAIVVGDIHGDLSNLTTILKGSRFLERVENNQKGIYLIFLGDYGDRGEESPEVYHAILRLKTLFPENIILLRGNHEGPEDLGVHPFDLPFFFRSRLGANWEDISSLFHKLFDSFYHALHVRGKYLMLHGGIPDGIDSIDDIAEAQKNHPARDILTQILWNDPVKGKGTYPSPRGAGKAFGEDVSGEILRMLEVKTLIRSHEPCEGVAPAHRGRVITVFSCKGPPYYNSTAAYLIIDLISPARDANQLAKEAHYF